MKITRSEVESGKNADVALPWLSGLSATQLHLAKGQAEGPPQERFFVAAMETGPTHRPGMVPERSQQLGLTTISVEEQKILHSLDRLNQQLLCEVFVMLCYVMTVCIWPELIGKLVVIAYNPSINTLSCQSRITSPVCSCL